MEMSNFTVVRAVLRNNYWSRNLIGPYRFWVISPRNSTSFTRPFLSGRRVRAGHKPIKPYWRSCRKGDVSVVTGVVGTYREFSEGPDIEWCRKKFFNVAKSQRHFLQLLNKFPNPKCNLRSPWPPIVAVLCRNRRLFRRIFRSHCCVRSAVSLNFR